MLCIAVRLKSGKLHIEMSVDELECRISGEELQIGK